MLPPKKALWAFVARFVLIFAVYSIPWRPIGTAYSTAAAALGNLVVGEEASPAVRLHFGPPKRVPDDARAAFGVELRAENVATGSALSIPIDLRTLTYVPTAVFVALCVDSPMWRGKRGVIVLLVGLFALHVFFVASIAAPLVLFFANPLPMHLVELRPVSHRLLDVFYRTLVAPLGMAFIVPGALWLVLLWLVLGGDVRVSADYAHDRSV